MERDQFTFYRSFWEALKALPKKDQLPFVMAVCSYAFGEESKPLTGASSASFLLVKPILDKAGKRAANGKLGGSKPQAKPKQTTSKPQANDKQTASKKEEEIEEELENECSPPNPPAAEFGADLQAALDAWLAYKSEKRQEYKPTGLKSLVTEIRRNAEKYGETAVADLIRACMASNWQGIIFDRLQGQAGGNAGDREDEAWKYIG